VNIAGFFPTKQCEGAGYDELSKYHPGQGHFRNIEIVRAYCFFIITISSSSVFAASVGISLRDGLGNTAGYSTGNGTYTMNDYVSLTTSFDGGYSSVQGVANYGLLAVRRHYKIRFGRTQAFLIKTL